MGSKETYETAYRCAAYISALTPITCVLGIVPYIGGAVGVALAMYFTIIATIMVHQIPLAKGMACFRHYRSPVDSLDDHRRDQLEENGEGCG